MTEEGWLNSWKYWQIYEAIRNRSSTRQLRLFMAACCRLKFNHFYDSRLHRALDAAERCAEDSATEEIICEVGESQATMQRLDFPRGGWEDLLATTFLAVSHLLDEYFRESPNEYHHWKHSLTHAVYMSIRSQPGIAFTGGTGDAAEYCAMLMNITDARLHGYALDRESYYQWDHENLDQQDPDFPSRISNHLRDIFGNPFRPVSFSPEWCTSDVVSIAQTMYDSRDFSPMPILADALQDAGCEREDILAHCRDANGTHVRGCWVVDLVLGKS